MKELNDGGPAFPPPLVFDKQGKNITWDYRGMSLRDWFAGHALAGMAGEYRTAQMYTCEFDETCESIAKSAYELADAMLKAREVRP